MFTEFEFPKVYTDLLGPEGQIWLATDDDRASLGFGQAHGGGQDPQHSQQDAG
jgi:hypothetical protein